MHRFDALLAQYQNIGAWSVKGFKILGSGTDQECNALVSTFRIDITPRRMSGGVLGKSECYAIYASAVGPVAERIEAACLPCLM